MTTFHGQDPAAAAPPEVARNGLATKLGTGGAGALVIGALIDAVTGGKVDSDTRTAIVSAVVLAAVTMIGKYAQAVAGIAAGRLGKSIPGEFVGHELEQAAGMLTPVAERRIADLAAASIAELLDRRSAGQTAHRIPPAAPR